MTTHPALAGLGVRERRILLAVLDGEATCARHPGRTDCNCSSGALGARVADADQTSEIAHDDRDTGLMVEQREALLGWLLAQYMGGHDADLSGAR